jgi:hypothetical protein
VVVWIAVSVCGRGCGCAQRWMSLHRGRSGEWLGSWVGMSVGGSVGRVGVDVVVRSDG